MGRLTIDRLDERGVIRLVGELVRSIADEYLCVIDKANIALRKTKRNERDLSDIQRLKWYEEECLTSEYFSSFMLTKDVDYFKWIVRKRSHDIDKNNIRLQMIRRF